MNQKPAILQRLFQQLVYNPNTRASYNLKEPSTELLQYLGISAGGVEVTTKSAMTIAAFWRAIAVKAESRGKIPVKVYQKNQSGRVQLPGHPVYKLLTRRPNPWMTPASFFESSQRQIDLWGDFLAVIRRDQRGQVYMLDPVILGKDSFEISKMMDGNYYKISWKDRGVEEVLSDDVIHINQYTLNGITGLSAVEYHRTTMGNSLGASKTSKAFFENGAMFSGYIKQPNKYRPETLKNLSESWRQEHHGIDNHYRSTPVLFEGAEFIPVSMPLKDAQFLETRQFSGIEVCQIVGVPPHKVFIMDRATHKNAEQMDQEFVNDALLPVITRLEQEINYKLFTEQEKDAGLYIKHNLNALIRGDMQARGEYYTKMLQNGVYSINQVREKEDENGIGPAGDAHRVQMQMQSVEQVDSLTAPRKLNGHKPAYISDFD